MSYSTSGQRVSMATENCTLFGETSLAAGGPPLQDQDDTPQGQIYYFPHLAVGAGWQTTITYINYSSEEVSCRTDFLSDQGAPLMVSFPSLGPVVRRSDMLPPGGSCRGAFQMQRWVKAAKVSQGVETMTLGAHSRRTTRNV